MARVRASGASPAGPTKGTCLPRSTFWCTAWMPRELLVSTPFPLRVSRPGSSVRQAQALSTQMVSWTLKASCMSLCLFVCFVVFCLFLWWHSIILSYQLYYKKSSSEKLLFFFWKIILDFLSFTLLFTEGCSWFLYGGLFSDEMIETSSYAHGALCWLLNSEVTAVPGKVFLKDVSSLLCRGTSNHSTRFATLFPFPGPEETNGCSGISQCLSSWQIKWSLSPGRSAVTALCCVWESRAL